MSATAIQLLGPDGPLARSLPGYEARSGQLEMAAAVERALKQERILLCEAGTGTGKTLAYLIPALQSGKKVVISTATRALQEQLVSKDLPLVEQSFGFKVKVAVMKGLGNYLCRRRYGQFLMSPEAARPKHARALTLISSWSDHTETGDFAELAALGEGDPVLSEVGASSETRIGANCAFFEQCFVTQMRREAESAQVIIVNHHLFFADLALRGPHPGRVLPDYDAVIFDEAHQLEDIAANFFGMRVSESRLERLAKEMRRAADRAGGPLFVGGKSSLPDELSAAARAFFAELRRRAGPSEGRITLEPDVWKEAAIEQGFHRLDNALEATDALAEQLSGRLAGTSSAPSGAEEELEVLSRRARQVREQVAGIIDGQAGRVTWLDTTGGRTALSSTPIDLGALFAERLFDVTPAVVLTSATLTSVGSGGSLGFEFLKRRLGLTGEGTVPLEAIVPSPFDFDKRALLYTPKDLPSPGSPEFGRAAAQRILDLIEICDGGCFVLTTSLRSMRQLHGLLRASLLGRPLFIQGEAPKSTLVARFRASGRAVLVATASFWEGVDVPGEALRLVVLEKIPFAVPTDPIAKARSLAIEARGGNAFLELHVPDAAIALKQGFGRLIRTQSDTGVVALLDERIHRRGYGPKLLRALPPARQTDSLETVRGFMQRAES